MKNGFTLIELLVIVLIVGILAAVALPQYNNAVEKSRFAESFILTSALGRAQDIYKLANDGPALTFEDLGMSVPNATPGTVPGGWSQKAGGGLRGKYFGYVIDTVNNSFWYGTIVVVRNSGKYQNCGFVYSDRQIYCVQLQGSTAPFCVNLYGGIKLKTDSGVDIYSIKN